MRSSSLRSLDHPADDGTSEPGDEGQHDEEAERPGEEHQGRAGGVGVAEHRRQRRQVEGEEHVLDDDDPEDQRGLGAVEAPRVDEDLGDDGRRRDADGAGDDERLLGPPSEPEADGEAATDVQHQVDRRRRQQPGPAGRQLVERELDPEGEEQEDQPEPGQQGEVARVVEQHRSRGVRPDDDARHDEEGDGREPDAPTRPGQQSGHEERGTEQDELVSHQADQTGPLDIGPS